MKPPAWLFLMISEACRAMGVGETAIRRWVHQLQGEHSGATLKAQ